MCARFVLCARFYVMCVIMPRQRGQAVREANAVAQRRRRERLRRAQREAEALRLAGEHAAEREAEAAALSAVRRGRASGR